MFNFPPYLKIPIICFKQPIVLQKIKQGVGGYVPVNTITEEKDIEAVVQPQKPEQLKIDSVDTSLQYILVHSLEEIKINDHIIYRHKKYRVIQQSNWGEYGYFRCVGEEIVV